MDSYITLRQAAADEFVEKRSRFIGAALPVTTGEQAVAFIAERRAEHHDASHNCYAYRLRGAVQRYSDDGEPQGTAGVPILEILRKENIVDSVIVVTRYFGGTLLGAGGLVRAYSQAAKLAVEAAGRVEVQPCTSFSLEIAYPLYGKIETLLQRYGAETLDRDFSERVIMRLRVPSKSFAALSSELGELSGGSIAPSDAYEEFA